MVTNFWRRCGINERGEGIFAFDALLSKLFFSLSPSRPLVASIALAVCSANLAQVTGNLPLPFRELGMGNRAELQPGCSCQGDRRESRIQGAGEMGLLLLMPQQGEEVGTLVPALSAC